MSLKFTILKVTDGSSSIEMDPLRLVEILLGIMTATGNWTISLFYSWNSREENDDSEWRLSIAGNQMTWTGIGTPRQESFKLVHVRVSEEE